MNRKIRLVALFAGGTVVLSFAVLVVNQTAQVVQLARTLHPTLGTPTLVALLAAYAGLIGVPVALVLRLPRPLVPPQSEHSPEFETHLNRLAERLRSNPQLAGRDLSDRRDVEEALGVLGEKANTIVRDMAATVFITTAVSQSGRLDGLLVLAAQSRMVWRIAHLYHQRPTPRDLVHLYANVAGTVFLAGELQDLDLGEQVEPVLSSAISALGVSLPGFQIAGAILANCVLSGSTNAFLTLRVGMIAKRHCGALVTEQKALLRRAATTEAAQYLGAIVADGSARISKAILRATADKVGDALSGAKRKGVQLLDMVRSYRLKEQPEVG
jgi:Domain of unknown function (DUF697)